METQKISMDIPVDMYDWLKENKVNRTKLFKKAANDLRYGEDVKERTTSSLYFLISIIGICFASIPIAVGSFMSALNIQTRAFLVIIGALTILLTTLLLYKTKEKRED